MEPAQLPQAKANKADSQGWSTLYRAASMEYSANYTQLLRDLLKQGAPVEPPGPSYPKPFNAVLENGDLEAVELMIDHGINLEHYVNQFPLHKAARNQRAKVLEFLLCMQNFDPNQKNMNGSTALFEAVRVSNFEAVELLLNCGAQANLVDNGGFTALHRVNYDGSKQTTKCVQLLLLNGADGDAMSSPGPNGESALFCAASSKYSSEYTKILKLFLENRVGKKSDDALYQPFKAVVALGDLEAVRLFLKHGVDLSRCKEYQLLRQAAANPRVEILEFLLSTGIFDISEKDHLGFTALHSAAQALNVEAGELLLDLGAEVDPINDRKFTPLHLAAFKAGSSQTEDACAKCIELLLLHGANINSKYYGTQYICTPFEMAHGKNIQVPSKKTEISPGAMKILAHANLLQSQGIHVDPPYFHRTKNESEQCRAELKLLKAEFLGDSVTLYDILVNKNNRFYSKKPELMQKLRDRGSISTLHRRFPIYGSRLFRIVEHVVLKEVAAEKLSRLMGIHRDDFYLIIDKIVRMFTRRDLRVLDRL